MIVFAALTAFFVIVVAILATIYVPIIHDEYRRYNIDLTDDKVFRRVKYWSIDNIVINCKRDAFVYKSKDGGDVNKMILNPGTLIVPTKWNTTKRLKLCIVLGYDNGYYVSRALRSLLQKDFLDFFYCEINNYEEIPDSKITFRSFTEEKFVTAVRENYMVDYPANQFHPGHFMAYLVMVFLDAVLIITSVVILTFQLSNMT